MRKSRFLQPLFYGLVSFAIWIFLSSCSSIKYFDIETRLPAEITFPKEVNRLLIVDNTLPQPPIKYKVGYLRILTQKIETERFTPKLARYQAENIAKDTVYFYDVRLYDGSFRVDDNYENYLPLTVDEVNNLCESQQVNAIASFDSLRITFETHSFSDDLDLSTIGISGVLNVSLQNAILPLAVIPIADTLQYWSDADPSTLIDAALQQTADGLTHYFIPTWNNDVRWFYTGKGALWKGALADIKADQWESAYIKWQALYDKETKPKQKAYIASNLALCSEFSQFFDKALDWAQIACQQFAIAGVNSKEAQLAARYVSVLSYRKLAEDKLLLQSKDK